MSIRYCLVYTGIYTGKYDYPAGYIANSWANDFVRLYSYPSFEEGQAKLSNPSEWEIRPVSRAVCKVLRSNVPRKRGLLIDGTVR